MERLRSARRHGREMFERAPRELVLEPPEPTVARLRKGPKEDPSGGDALAAALLAGLCEGIRLRWRELRAVERVIEEVAREFDGEDPAIPRVRCTLDGTKEKIEEVRRGVQRYVGQLEVPEPDEDDLEMVRALLRRAESFYT